MPLKPASQVPTALLLIDIQKGVDVASGYYGAERSTPEFESNVSKILTQVRAYNGSLDGGLPSSDRHKEHRTKSRHLPRRGQDGDAHDEHQQHDNETGTSTPASTSAADSDKPSYKPYAISIHHMTHASIFPDSPVYPGKASAAIQDCAAPLAHEPVYTKSTHSAFHNADLVHAIREAGTRQLIIAGVTTDHCVSTSTRHASDLGLVNARPLNASTTNSPPKPSSASSTAEPNGDGGAAQPDPAPASKAPKPDNDDDEQGTIVLLSDCTACFNKVASGIDDPELVQRVTLASLNGEFCDVMESRDVLGVLFAG